MQSLDDMAVFERVATLLSFTRAAEQLGLSKASVSARVARLEKRLGVRLLQRTTRRVRPTDAGRVYAERCRRVLSDAREADLEASAEAPRPHGVLRVTCPRMFGTAFLAPILADYLERYPDVRTDVLLTERFVDLVEEGFDVGIRIGRLASSSLVARKLGDAAAVRVRAPDGADAVIGIGPRRSDERAAVDSLEMARDLAIAGVGSTELPRFVCAAALEEGRLVEMGDSRIRYPIHLVYPARVLLAARVRVFVDLVVERTAQPPW